MTTGVTQYKMSAPAAYRVSLTLIRLLSMTNRWLVWSMQRHRRISVPLARSLVASMHTGNAAGVERPARCWAEAAAGRAVSALAAVTTTAPASSRRALPAGVAAKSYLRQCGEERPDGGKARIRSRMACQGDLADEEQSLAGPHLTLGERGPIPDQQQRYNAVMWRFRTGSAEALNPFEDSEVRTGPGLGGLL